MSSQLRLQQSVIFPLMLQVSKHKGVGTAHRHLQAAWAKILVLWAKLKV